MVKIDGAIAVAANVQFEIVNLGHGFLRAVSIAGFAINVGGGCRRRGSKTLRDACVVLEIDLIFA
jgi:hypothetical protein